MQPAVIRVRLMKVWACKASGGVAYRAVEYMLSVVLLLLDVILESVGVERLQQLEATQELRVDRHDSSPVVKFTAVLLIVSFIW